MRRHQDSKAEETKRNIENAATILFATRGYDGVTMREIAKAAGCSHTLIYLYYKDKEDLLQQMSLPVLRQLEIRMKEVLTCRDTSPFTCLQSLSRDFVGFCLIQRSMVSIFFGLKSERADESSLSLEVNALRGRLFACLREAMNRCLPGQSEEAIYHFSRLYFFMIQGIIMTYQGNKEPLNELLDRIIPMVDDGLDIMLAGFREVSNQNEAS